MLITSTTLVVVVHNAILLEGIVSVIEADPGLLLLASATTVEAGLKLLREHQPECVVLDLDISSASSMPAAEAILAAHPNAKIIGLATYELDGRVSRALEVGVRAVIGKHQILESLTETIRRTSRAK